MKLLILELRTWVCAFW